MWKVCMQEKIGQSTVNYGFMFYCETNLPVVLLKLNDVIKYILPTLTCLIIVQQILLFFGKKFHLHTLIKDLRVCYFMRFFLQNLISTYIIEKKILPTHSY